MAGLATAPARRTLAAVITAVAVTSGCADGGAPVPMEPVAAPAPPTADASTTAASTDQSRSYWTTERLAALEDAKGRFKPPPAPPPAAADDEPAEGGEAVSQATSSTTEGSSSDETPGPSATGSPSGGSTTGTTVTVTGTVVYDTEDAVLWRTGDDEPRPEPGASCDVPRSPLTAGVELVVTDPGDAEVARTTLAGAAVASLETDDGDELAVCGHAFEVADMPTSQTYSFTVTVGDGRWTVQFDQTTLDRHGWEVVMLIQP